MGESVEVLNCNHTFTGERQTTQTSYSQLMHITSKNTLYLQSVDYFLQGQGFLLPSDVRCWRKLEFSVQIRLLCKMQSLSDLCNCGYIIFHYPTISYNAYNVVIYSCMYIVVYQFSIRVDSRKNRLFIVSLN